MNQDAITARYLVETPWSLEQAAESIAGEQSTGTFVNVPGETETLKKHHKAEVVSIKPFEAVHAPSLPGASSPPAGSTSPVYRRGEVEIAYPLRNVGPNLPAALTTVSGNLSELKQLSGLRLLDVDFPQAFADRYPGPAYGIKRTRDLLEIYDRPIVGTIIKPSVGLSPDETAKIVRELAIAGVDFIKDDELMADPPHSPFDQRVKAVMAAISEVSDMTGKQPMYAFNVTDDLDRMLRHHDTVLEAGGSCIMISVNSVGLAAVSRLREHSQLPIHGHRNGWGVLTRFPLLGMEFTAYHKFWRLAGVDHLHVNGIDNKFWEPNESVVRSIRACTKPLFSASKDYAIMPVISSGQWGGQAPETYAQGQTVDLMYLAGGGIMAHPGGPAAGFRAIVQAWEAAVSGESLESYAERHTELRQAIAKFSAPPKSGTPHRS